MVDQNCSSYNGVWMMLAELLLVIEALRKKLLSAVLKQQIKIFEVCSPTCSSWFQTARHDFLTNHACWIMFINRLFVVFKLSITKRQSNSNIINRFCSSINSWSPAYRRVHWPSNNHLFQFKRLLTRELSQHADHSQSGNQVTSYIRSFIGLQLYNKTNNINEI